MGRPKKNHKAITFFLSEDEHKRAQAVIDRTGISYYQLAKTALNHYLLIVEAGQVQKPLEENSEDLLA
jgi:hypothetical protein